MAQHIIEAELDERLPDLSELGKGFVNHGADANVVRPTGFASVEWYGTVEPVNALEGDTWIDIS